MKLHFVEEPALTFHNQKQHVDIKAGLSLYGAYDKGGSSVPKPIRVGVVGTTATLDGVRDWLERCKQGVASTEQKLKALRPSFPGMTDKVFGTSLEVSDAHTRTITRHELTEVLQSPKALLDIVETFLVHAKDLAAKSGLHVLIIAPPQEVFDLGDANRVQAAPGDPPMDETQELAPEQAAVMPASYNFHDLFKARALDLPIPCQLLRPDTYGSATDGARRRLQDKATMAWNFHTALYYKAGGVPWRLSKHPSQLATCYMGVSFFKSVTGESLMTSVAQVFDERGEGLIVQGGSASYDKDDRIPHLSEADAHSLLADGLAAYRREHKTSPARLLMHKTSRFNEAEKKGFAAAAGDANLEVLDLVSVRRSGTRVLRSSAPMDRGAVLLFDDASGIVYLKGTVPYFEIYPGAYIPRAVEFSRESGEGHSAQLAAELVGLSKLNFNNTQFDAGDPITVRAARRVGDILKHVPIDKKITSRFRYFT